MPNYKNFKNSPKVKQQNPSHIFLLVESMSQQFFQILSRVYTFTTGSWPYISRKELCPYRLASLGYSVTNPYVLECFVCHHKITVPQDFQVDYQQVIGQLGKHKENCIYHKGEEIQGKLQAEAFSKEELYLMIDEVLLFIKKESINLTQIKKYPALNKQEIEKAIKQDIFTFKSIDQAYKLNLETSIKIPFFLSFFGWMVKINLIKANELYAECVFCGRKLFFNSKILETQDQSKSINFKENETFSPVSQHRYFCLWTNAKTSGFKGYSIMIQHLFDKINESKSLFSKRSPTQTKKIRVQMDKYLETFQQKTTEQFQKIRAIFNQCETMKKVIQQKQGGNLQEELFAQGEKRMNEFVKDVIGDEIRGQIKKIKLN